MGKYCLLCKPRFEVLPLDREIFCSSDFGSSSRNMRSGFVASRPVISISKDRGVLAYLVWAGVGEIPIPCARFPYTSAGNQFLQQQVERPLHEISICLTCQLCSLLAWRCRILSHWERCFHTIRSSTLSVKCPEEEDCATSHSDPPKLSPCLDHVGTGFVHI